MKEVKTKVKKVIALLAAMVMVLAMGVPVMAEGETYTIKITAMDASADHQFSAYQIFKGTLDGETLVDVEWGSGVKDTDTLLTAIKAIKISESETFDSIMTQDTAASVADVLAQYSDDSEVVKKFAEVVKGYLNTDSTPTSLTPGGGGVYTASISQTDAGYYLIQDASKTNTSDLILKVVGNVDVRAKIDVPSVVKYAGKEAVADNADFSIGEAIPYTVTGTLPDVLPDAALQDGAVYTCTFTDTMDATLDLFYTKSTSNASQVDGGVTVMIGNADVTSSFEIIYANHVLTVTGDLNALKNADGNAVSVKGGDEIVVTYEAVINNTADAGQAVNNTVVLETEYDDTTTTTPEVVETVYPLQLNLTKVDGNDNTVVLSGAKFRLYYTDENGDALYAVVGSDGKVVRWVTEEKLADEPSATLVSDEAGKIDVVGLGAGTYMLEEIEAPEGYNKLTEAVMMEIQATVTAGATGNTLTVLTIEVDRNGAQPGDIDNASVSATIENNKGAQLPSTGGIGTTIFYVIGGILVVGAGVLLIVRKRMNSEK